MITITTVTIKREAKITTGQYENTVVGAEITATLSEGESVTLAAARLMGSADEILRTKIDDIELGKRKVASKAGRFGV